MKKLFSALVILSAILLCNGPLSYAQTTTYVYTGAVQTYLATTTAIQITAIGGLGGGYAIDRGGYGGKVVCTLAVTPGVLYDVYVGGKGGVGPTGTAGYNGGVAGFSAAGGGGGASDLRMPPYSLSQRLVVAGGGGGGTERYGSANYDRGGNGGGLTGEQGYTDNTYAVGTNYGGYGGTPSAGGGGGYVAGWVAASAGTFGVGGTGSTSVDGPGGGGGWYGGGGGDFDGAGGGSSYTDPLLGSAVVHTQGYNTVGTGTVIITTLCFPPVSGTVSESGPVCVGTTANLTTTTTAGGTWMSLDTFVAKVNTTTGVVTGIAAGTALISYQITYPCGSAYGTHVVNVNPLPDSILGASTVCSGAISWLADSSHGGLWTSSSTSIATIGSVSGVVTSLTIGTLTMYYTLPTGCVMPFPVIVEGFTGANTVCAGNTTVMASVDSGMWSSSATSLATIDSTGKVTGISMGTLVISYTLPVAGCTALHTLTVYPLAPVAGHDSVCLGGVGYLTDIVGGGIWTSQITSVATISPDSGLVHGIIVGITPMTYTLPTGCVAYATMRVVNNPPAITGLKQVCPNSSVSLFDGTGGGTWSSNNIYVATVGSLNGIVSALYADTVTIFYTIKPGCTVGTQVTVNPLPAPISGKLTECPYQLDTMMDPTPTGTWSSLTTPQATVTANGIVTTLSGGQAIIKYALSTGCAMTQTINIYPAPTPVVTYDSWDGTFYCDTPFVTYQWYDSIQGPIPGANSPTLAALYTEYYYVVVTDKNGCWGASADMEFNAGGLGLGSANKHGINVYPNPTDGMLYVASADKIKAIISDINGRQVVTAADAHAIDMSKLSPGTYLLSIFDENNNLLVTQNVIRQ